MYFYILICYSISILFISSSNGITSTKGVIRLNKIQRALIKISPNSNLFSRINGLMISDGHAQRRSSTGNTRIIFTQSGKYSKYGFFMVVWELLKPFSTIAARPKYSEWTDNDTNTVYSKISLSTMQLPCFNIFREIWYSESGVKIVPHNIYTLIDLEMMAFWIMGDGSLQNEGLHLSTYAFSINECEILKKALTDKFDITCSIHHSKSGPRIYINKASMNKLRPLLLPLIHPSMHYKINA